MTGSVTTPDDRQLITCTWGDGPDLVVMEAGLGFSGRYWAPVARRLSGAAWVVAYDRAGLGDSTPDTRPRTLDRLADDLRTVVRHQPAGGRLVLVGHSWGGPIVRAAAPLLSDRSLAGLVLVDPSDEGAPLYDSRIFVWSERVQAVLLPTLARTGLLRRSMALVAGRLPSGPDRAATVAASSTPAAARAAVEESRHVRAGLELLRHREAAPNLSLTVISGVKGGWAAFGRAELNEAHRRRARTSTRGRFVAAHRSQHLVPLTEPDVVADEVIRLLRPT